jgi:hypothetical protein
MPRRPAPDEPLFCSCAKSPLSLFAALLTALLATRSARADVVEGTFDPLHPTSIRLPSVTNPFIQYGVAFTTEFVAQDSALCNSTSKVVQCLLGSGAGLVFPRVGWRSPGHWYLGGAYEFSKHDAGTVYLLPILQQLRAEARYYLFEGHVGTPFIEGSLGLAGYGNEWTVDSYGPAVSLAIGVEAQISRNTVVGGTLAYRAIHFSGFTDSAGTSRSDGFTQLVGLNILLEVRDPY